jgi:histone-lysine N-methyltransferase SETMAR
MEKIEFRADICCQLLNYSEADSDYFLYVIMDESWVHHFHPETKQSGMEWRHSNSPPPKKFRVQSSAGKVMFSVFVAFKILKKGHTITGAYYASLLTKLRENIKLKCKGMLSNGVLLQHDNSSSHTCVAATSKAAELAFQILPQSPYSPDLAPSDYHLFKNIKQHLRGTHFKDDVSVQNAVTQWLEDQNADFYKEGILKLKHRWQKCIDLQGDCIENVKIVQNVSK